MSAFFQRGLLQTENLLVQCKRFRGKINIQRPRPPFYTRKLFEAVTKPVYPYKTAIDLCHEKRALNELSKNQEDRMHPYEKIMARELFECFDSAKMTLLCHKNSMNAFEFFNFKVAMHKKGIKTKVYSRKVISAAIKDTNYEAMLTILTKSMHNCMLFGSEWNVNDALKVLKKTPKVLLLAGSLGDRFMSKSQLENYARLPELPIAQAQFVATLNSIGGQLTNHLQAHQSNLAYMLDAHANALNSSEAGTADSNPNSTKTEDKPT